ncbi:transposase domain-containing protein [Companilactobacillus baiquanensis]|uniref:Transposase IS66 C-terminal domain-containing protein n=1 Tax=Companilactobacillus baiquanensis TaxID=2486005 RepID=A0ABW1UWM7_9LACO|nr:transposase domain-containing protein [Companilactobacillus baiquanensis]
MEVLNDGRLEFSNNTAEAQGLDPRKYLNYLFNEIPHLEVINQESLMNYMPWSQSVLHYTALTFHFIF